MYIIILLLTFIPILYRFSFWLYTIQLKEYRLDRFKEYLYTPQGKKAIINIGSVIEIPLLFLSCLILINQVIFENIVSYIMFYTLLAYNIFVLGKILRKQLLMPKITSRMKVLIFFSFLVFSTLFIFILSFNYLLIYIFIFLMLILNPFFIFLNISLLSPIVNYSKNKIINEAIKKSKQIQKPIKIAITGSYGKSTVKEFLSHILGQKSDILKTPENINTELGVSDIVLNKLSDKFKYFVAEIGAYKMGEIETLGKIVNHKYGFLTAIGNQHLGLFGNIENTKKAKFEIAKKVIENDGVLYINGDNKYIIDYLEKGKDDVLKGLNFIKYNVNKKHILEENTASSVIEKIENGFTYFSMNYKGQEYSFETNLIGKHNIINITGVLAFCIDMGLKTKELQKYLKNMVLPKNTLEIKDTIRYKLINDTYNLSEDGLFAGLEVLNSFGKDKQKILVIDDILELGDKSFEIHESIGERIAKQNLVNKIMFVGVNYNDSLKKGLIKYGFKEENIITDLNHLKDDSIVLFEGRNTKKYFDKLAK